MKRYILAVFAVLFAALPADAIDRYVSPTGLDTNAGTIFSPFRTIGKALSVRMPGEPIILRDGEHAASFGSNLIVPVEVRPYQGESVTLRLPDGQILALPLSIAVWTDAVSSPPTSPPSVPFDVKITRKPGGKLSNVRVSRRNGDTSTTMFVTVNKSTVVVIE